MCITPQAARLLTLYAAKRCLGLDPISVRVIRSAYGRPHLEGNVDFDFNLSHNGDFTLLTSCHKMRTGVDVMKMDLPREFLRRFFRLLCGS